MTLDLATLINTIIEEYKRRTGDEKLVEEFIEKVGKSGTYADVYALAKKAGLSLENAIIDTWTFDKNEVYFETMKQLLLKVTGPMHDDIAKACKHIQESMNAASGFKLKPQISEINGYDIDDIADRMKNQGITRIMGELQTLGCKIVDDTEQANMDMLTSSGYEIKIVRTYDDVGLTTGAGKKKDCQFCLDLEGEHEFYSTREARYSGVFSRHPKCGCTIDYTSKKTGKTDYNIQNFHSAKTPRITRDEETARNREMYENYQAFYGSPKSEEVKENINEQRNADLQRLNSILRSFNPVKQTDAVPTARKEAKSWIEKISDAAKKLINLYTYNPNDTTPQFYQRINAFIRDEYTGEKDYTEQVNIISEALKSSKLQNNYVCFRGSDYNPFIQLKVGETGPANQFLSTSLRKRGAFKKNYKIIVFARKGTNAAYIEDLSMEGYKKQREMLFDKDVQYELLYSKNNICVVRTIP